MNTLIRTDIIIGISYCQVHKYLWFFGLEKLVLVFLCIYKKGFQCLYATFVMGLLIDAGQMAL